MPFGRLGPSAYTISNTLIFFAVFFEGRKEGVRRCSSQGLRGKVAGQREVTALEKKGTSNDRQRQIRLALLVMV